jgi:radical SAM superfamily enzyme YgiQ (UPF0313 family)
MRVAMVMPSWLPEDIFPTKTARSQVNYWQPLGVLYVSASLLKEGHEVRFFDGSFLGHQELLGDVRKYGPEMVGIYSNTPLWNKARKTAEDVKAISEDIYVVVGGPHPIAKAEEALEGCTAVDAAVTGEGEQTIVEVASRVEKGEGLDGVKGVVYREGETLRRNPPRPLIQDLDSIPFPARHLLMDPELYSPPLGTYRKKPVATLITSRGCDSRCIYCFQIGKERMIRYRSVENVMEELELCLDQGYREIRFLDDTFTGDYDRAMRIAREIKRRGLDFPWYVSSRVNTVDEKLLRAFKEAGCWAILFGAESGVQKNLNTLRKGITLEQTRRAVRAAKKAGLKVCLPFIFGIPGETYDEALKTIEFACELDPDFANFHTLAPFPGTELYERAEEMGTVSGNLEDFTFEGAAFIPYSMTREEIELLRSIAFRRFYSRPGFILKKLLGIRSRDDLRMVTSGLKSLFWIWAKKDLFKLRRGRKAA